MSHSRQIESSASEQSTPNRSSGGGFSRRSVLQGLGTGLGITSASGQTQTGRQRRRNVIFILTDDHRYDALGFLKGQPFVETPHLDSLARDGAHLKNAFVCTSLCSPSRASILTGKYAHQHRIVDNNTAIPSGTAFFPQLLKQAGYATAFVGKWHMGGESDDAQPGFDHWVSFRGQGTYLPSENGLNVDGKRVAQRGYITTELTDYALTWLEKQQKDQPYFLYLSHKATHSDFIPEPKYKGRYDQAQFVPPHSMNVDEATLKKWPMWVRNQRNSWHGVDFPYYSKLSIPNYYKQYAETLLSVDDSTGRVLDALRKRGELDSTLIIYMGDNGFQFGEHGLIDKRTAYEASMRVPMLARCPELFTGGRVVDQVVANIDIMPTVLDAAGVTTPQGLPGRSFLNLLQGKQTPWRDSLLYTYYWEHNYPMTPTTFALRGDRYKYIHYYGIWDLDELYDLHADPQEINNLAVDLAHQQLCAQMNKQLFTALAETGGMSIPLYPDRGRPFNLRDRSDPGAAPFPPGLLGSPSREPQA
jgi:N-acetylglucosamine-6-sulfatase